MAFTKVTGTLVDIGDLDLTNVGQIQLDSIAGDADANTSITFSGSDVITIATGGAGRLTIGDGALSPVTDNQIDLGTSSLEFKDAFFDGTVTSDAFAGPLTGDVTGTIQTAAQPNITSVGTLTGFTSTGIDDNADATAITIGSDESVDFAKGVVVLGSGTTAGVYLNGTNSDTATHGNFVRYGTNFATQSNSDNSLLITKAFNGSTFLDAFTVKSDGNVGIGTTSPDSTLHVKGAADAYLTLEAGATDGNTAILMQNSGGTQEAFILYDTDDNNMQFGVNSAERMRIDSSGRVGINRTPAISNSKLEVGGADNVPLINVEASGATAGVGIGSSRMKFYYGTTEKASIDSNGNLRTARQILQENSDGTPRFINIPFSSAGSGFTFNWDDLANHSAVGDQTSESNAFMFEVNVTSYLFRRVKALIIVDTNADNSIAVHTIHNSTLTCSASIPTGSESITITIGGLWSNAVNYMGRITTF